MDYVVVIEKTGNGYGAYVPDLPGCVAAGARSGHGYNRCRRRRRMRC